MTAYEILKQIRLSGGPYLVRGPGVTPAHEPTVYGEVAYLVSYDASLPKAKRYVDEGVTAGGLMTLSIRSR
ncbi:MAG: hypothetical protein ACYDCC_10225 [Actinomycetota bacterium]